MNKKKNIKESLELNKDKDLLGLEAEMSIQNINFSPGENLYLSEHPAVENED